MPSDTIRHPVQGERTDGRRGWLDAVLSLQCKATGLVVVLTLSVVAGVSAYLIETGEEFAHAEHNAQIIRLASVLAKAAAPEMIDGSRDRLLTLASEAADDDPFLYVVFMDAQRNRLAVAEHAGAAMLEALPDVPERGAAVPGRPVCRTDHDGVPLYYDLIYPVVASPASWRSGGEVGPAPAAELVGYVRVGTRAHIWDESMRSKLDLLIGVGILATFAAIPLGFLLVRRIVSPLDALVDVMHRFSAGELDVRSPVGRRDEIGRLSHVFNAMADQHQRTHESIVRLNAELERRVAQRTRQLRELASREPLTGLYNRRHFNEVLDRSFAEARRYQHDLSCIMIDLDRFKEVNDAYGHHVGDDLLIVTAATISSQLRGADLAARFGGDEFILLMPQTDADSARTVAERIAVQFMRDVAERIPQVRVTMSMGIATIPAVDVQDAEDLVRAADGAMYDAKAAGKNRIATAAAARSATH